MELISIRPGMLRFGTMPWGLSATHLLAFLMRPSDLPVVDLSQYGDLDPDNAARHPDRTHSWTALLRGAGYSVGSGGFHLLVPFDGGVVVVTLHVEQDEKAMSVFIRDAEGEIAELTPSGMRVHAPETAAGKRRRVIGRRALFLLGLTWTGGAALFKALDGVTEIAKREGQERVIRTHLRRGHYRRRKKDGMMIWIPPVIVNLKHLPEQMRTNEAVAGAVYILVPDEEQRRDLAASRSLDRRCTWPMESSILPRLVAYFDLPVAVNACAYLRASWALKTVLAQQARHHRKPRAWQPSFDEAVALLSPVIGRFNKKNDNSLGSSAPGVQPVF